jgi:branched-chain amino acid transport system ATP-binding protein
VTALLELSDLRVGYQGGPDILKGLSLEIVEGRSYCVVGPNGAGKSTMLKAIAGLLPTRSGTVRLDGRDIGRLRPDQRLAAGVCFVPQDPSIFPEMSVHENLIMGAFLVDDRSLVRQRLDRVYSMFPILGERAKQAAGTMSGGQQQQLLIGRALMIDPKVLMIDEPSLGLAPKIADQIFEVIEGLGEMGVTVLMVEQSVVRGLRSTDWAFVLDLGTKRFEGASEDLFDDERIRDLYLGKMSSGGRE